MKLENFSCCKLKTKVQNRLGNKIRLSPDFVHDGPLKGCVTNSDKNLRSKIISGFDTLKKTF